MGALGSTEDCSRANLDHCLRHVCDTFAFSFALYPFCKLPRFADLHIFVASLPPKFIEEFVLHQHWLMLFPLRRVAVHFAFLLIMSRAHQTILTTVVFVGYISG